MNDLQRHMLTTYQDGRFKHLIEQVQGAGPLHAEHVVLTEGTVILRFLWGACDGNASLAIDHIDNVMRLLLDAKAEIQGMHR